MLHDPEILKPYYDEKGEIRLRAVMAHPAVRRYIEMATNSGDENLSPANLLLIIQDAEQQKRAQRKADDERWKLRNSINRKNPPPNYLNYANSLQRKLDLSQILLGFFIILPCAIALLLRTNLSPGIALLPLLVALAAICGFLVYRKKTLKSIAWNRQPLQLDSYTQTVTVRFKNNDPLKILIMIVISKAKHTGDVGNRLQYALNMHLISIFAELTHYPNRNELHDMITDGIAPAYKELNLDYLDFQVIEPISLKTKDVEPPEPYI